MTINCPHNGLPKLVSVSPTSPIKNQIPQGFRENCFIGWMRSSTIGCVQPKTKEEFVETINKAQEGSTKLELLLIKMKEQSSTEATTVAAASSSNQPDAAATDARLDPSADTAIDAITVGGLSWKTTDETLRHHFEQYGEVVSAEIM